MCTQSSSPALRAHFVSSREFCSDYSERSNPRPLSTRRVQRPWPWEQRQIAQSCAGDSQWDRSFNGLQSKPNPLVLETEQQPWKYPPDILSRSMPIQPNNTPSHILCFTFSPQRTPRYRPSISHLISPASADGRGWTGCVLFVQYVPRLKSHLVAGNGWLQPTRGYSNTLKRNGAQAVWPVWTVCVDEPPTPHLQVGEGTPSIGQRVT